MKKLNADGPEVLGNLPRVPGLGPRQFADAIEDGVGPLIDTRSMLAFGGGHIRGALNIGGMPILSIWAGWLLEPEEPILLVLDDDRDLDRIVRYFVRTGFTRFAGYLVGGMRAWDNAALPLEVMRQLDVQELEERLSDVQIVDVRSPGEWAQGHLPGARHIFVPELRSRIEEIDSERPTAVYCDSGYRASITGSILKQEGFGAVHNVPGSWRAWQEAGCPVETE